MADNPFRPRGGNGRQQLPEEVATYVRELIMSGQAKPGEFLRTEPIAEAVGVSNTPVREGLLSLRSEGFVELVPRRGFVVAPVSRQDIRDLFWAQAQFSSELAARAAKKITTDELERLEAINEDFEKAVEAGDQETVARLGHEFHRRINLAAGSHRLTMLLSSVVKHLPNRFYASIEEHVTATRNDHAELVQALRGRHARKARTIAEQHILEGADSVIKMLEERGLWSDGE
ncbi:GntR family transcriptional regulator [Amycolatopsis australiensis]|uniref:DNA-binding transcriptional regulator, GntR family n=1 Tax=Amycolatopsis australiensis TaxID=546364 RepID=A0A1K1S6L4_9PSEU|nr:GntR family transcriptional regulator [Amycolatopsis australiensis]SFW79858.1 DNA-binding transcriptional regulator, GntR family [Amycolatopsis australiensis]